jgi:hypothetical protein
VHSSGRAQPDSADVIFARVVTVVLGVALVLITIGSAIKTIVVPRATSSYITGKLFRIMRAIFGLIAHPKRSYETRDRILASFAPVSLVLLPGVWVTLCTVGFAGINWGLGGLSVREAFLTSGSSIFTLGVLFHRDLPHALVTYIEAMIGLGLVSLMISYMPTIYTSFSRREQLVGMLEVRAGLAPSPAEMLLRYNRIGWLGNLSSGLFPQWEEWFADVEESHSSHPALVYFRSTHPSRSWITAAGVVLDTASLLLSVVDIEWSPQAALLIRSGSFSLRRVSETFRIPYDPDPRPTDPISVSRREFDLLCVELEAGAIPLKADRDQAWRDFAGWRVNYDPVLVGLARLVVAPPARWSSDRT